MKRLGLVSSAFATLTNLACAGILFSGNEWAPAIAMIINAVAFAFLFGFYLQH